MDWGRLGGLGEDWEGLGKVDYTCIGPGEGWASLTLSYFSGYNFILSFHFHRSEFEWNNQIIF